MRIEFLKMQGLGNDFMIVDATAESLALIDAAKIRALADRHTGVGFDQALVLEAPHQSAARVFYRVFNSDGSEVEQCGNGARCVAALLYERQPELGREFLMESAGGPVLARICDDGKVSLDMGVPNFAPSALPLDAPGEASSYTLDVDGGRVELAAVSLGNPHAVLRVSDVRTAPVERLGAAIERHPRFAQRTNVGFMQILDRGHIRLRVYERGAGETLACGTGACAAAAVGQRDGLLDPQVRVDLPGGTASVSWAGRGHHVWLTGPATRVFCGSIDI